MTKIEEWYSCNKLTLNIVKTCFISFKSIRCWNVNMPGEHRGNTFFFLMFKYFYNGKCLGFPPF